MQSRTSCTTETQFLLAQQRLDCAGDSRLTTDFQPITDLERLLSVEMTGRRHLVAAAKLIAIVDPSHRPPRRYVCKAMPDHEPVEFASEMTGASPKPHASDLLDLRRIGVGSRNDQCESLDGFDDEPLSHAGSCAAARRPPFPEQLPRPSVRQAETRDRQPDHRLAADRHRYPPGEPNPEQTSLQSPRRRQSQRAPGPMARAPRALQVETTRRSATPHKRRRASTPYAMSRDVTRAHWRRGFAEVGDSSFIRSRLVRRRCATSRP